MPLPVTLSPTATEAEREDESVAAISEGRQVPGPVTDSVMTSGHRA